MDSPSSTPWSNLPPALHLSRWRRLRRWLLDNLKAAWKTVWRVTLGRYIFIKLARFPDVEVATMRFVRSRTTIPVPRVFGTISSDFNSKWIFMTRIPGQPLYPRLWDSYSEAERERILGQLRDFVSQLRAIGPPPSSPPYICSILGGPVLDHRLCVEEPYGPYHDEEQMNLQIRLGKTPEGILSFQRRPQEYAEDIRKSHALRHPIVFTHGDIALRNIMVDGDRVTGFIDWETAGWFPAHWEYVKACWVDMFPHKRFHQDLAKFIPPYAFENRVDQIIGWDRCWQPSLDIPRLYDIYGI